MFVNFNPNPREKLVGDCTVRAVAIAEDILWEEAFLSLAMLGSLDAVDKLTHSIKSIDTIIAMEESGYSNEYANEYSGRNMSRGRDGRYSYARGRRGGRRGYSRDDSMMSMKYQLQDMLEDANTEEEHRMIQKWMKQVED